MKRRKFLKGLVTGAAGVSCIVSDAANATQSASLGNRLDSWSKAIDASFASLPTEAQEALLRNNCAIDIDELKLVFAKRFPLLDANEVLTRHPRIRAVLDGAKLAASDYERSRTHDKESHDKTPDHDKGAHSRS
jgi:hypothetical protein